MSENLKNRGKSNKPKFINRSVKELPNWFEKERAKATIQVFPASLGENAPWGFTRRYGGVEHDYRNPVTGDKPKYFIGDAIKVSHSGREVDAFGQLGLTEVPDPSDPAHAVGTIGLLIDKRTGNILLQTGAEAKAAPPGSPSRDFVVIRPSLQGSYSNLNEHKVPFSDQVDIKNYNNFILLNPARIEGKVRVGITYVNGRKIDLKDHPNYQWFSMHQINKAIEADIIKGPVLSALKILDVKHKHRYRLPFVHMKDGKSEVSKRDKKKKDAHHDGKHHGKHKKGHAPHGYKLMEI